MARARPPEDRPARLQRSSTMPARRCCASRAAAAAGTVAYALDASPAERPVLAWRWKVDRVVGRADLAEKSGDDFAARVYVFFDVPLEALPFGARVKTLLARAVWGEELPTAAICYVWDNRHPPGTSAWNPYTDRVRTVVLRSDSPGALGRGGARPRRRFSRRVRRAVDEAHAARHRNRDRQRHRPDGRDRRPRGSATSPCGGGDEAPRAAGRRARARPRAEGDRRRASIPR